jgi:hypothetical protein
MFYPGLLNAGLYSPYNRLGYGACGALGAYGNPWGAHPLGAYPLGASAFGAYPYGGYGFF